MTDKPKVTRDFAKQWPQTQRQPASYASAYLAGAAEQSQDDGSEMMTDKPKVTQADERRVPISLYLGPFMRDQHTPLDDEGLRWLADQLCVEERVHPDRTMSTGYIPYQAAYEFPHLLDRLIAAEQSRDDVIEECVRVADALAANAGQNYSRASIRAHKVGYKGEQIASTHIAQALRNLKGKKS